MAKQRNTPSRADRIRERRSSHRQKPVRQTQPQPQQVERRSLPPVMVRGGEGVQTLNRRTPRRRYDIPLNTTGAEMRLPSVPIVRPGWRILSSILVFVLIGAMYYLMTSPQFQITAVELQGAQRLSSQDMNKTLYGLLGKTIFEVKPVDVEKTILTQYPDLVDVNVQVGLPATLKIQASERQPVLIWVMEESTQWIDATGVAFPVRDPALQLPVVQAVTMPAVSVESTNETGVETGEQEEMTKLVDEYQPEKFMDPSMVTAVKKLTAYAPPEAIFAYHEDHGFGWQAEQGWQVYFGLDVKDIDMKLKVYDSVVDHLVAENIQPALVDMEFVHAPYYRMER